MRRPSNPKDKFDKCVKDLAIAQRANAKQLSEITSLSTALNHANTSIFRQRITIHDLTEKSEKLSKDVWKLREINKQLKRSSYVVHGVYLAVLIALVLQL